MYEGLNKKLNSELSELLTIKEAKRKKTSYFERFDAIIYGGWEIALIIITAPLWGSLLFGILTIVAVVYGSIWMIAGSLWIVDGSLAMFSLAGIINSLISVFQGNGLNFLAYIGLALASVGLAIFLFFGALRVTKMIVELTKRLTLRIKKIIC